MLEPKISVIVPIYQLESYLRRCLDSIVTQTYTNLEIILVDDGSTDRSKVICDAYASQDARILVLHREHAGVSAARNAALDMATGEYLGFVDGDDWIEPDMYEYLMRLITNHNADLAQCGLFPEGAGSARPLFTFSGDTTAFSGEAGLSAQEWDKLNFGPCNKLYRAAACSNIRFDPTLSIQEDLIFNLQVLAQPSKLVFGAEAKYHYLQRSSSACFQPITAAYIYEKIKPMERYKQLLACPSLCHFDSRKHLTLTLLDLCSKFVLERNHLYQGERPAVKRTLRTLLRNSIGEILRSTSIPPKEKAKSLLVSYVWWIYVPLLRLSKFRFRKTIPAG